MRLSVFFVEINDKLKLYFTTSDLNQNTFLEDFWDFGTWQKSRMMNIERIINTRKRNQLRKIFKIYICTNWVIFDSSQQIFSFWFFSEMNQNLQMR